MVEACFGALEAAGVKYAVLHGVEDIPDRIESDIDIIVTREAMPDLTHALSRFARDHGGCLCQVIRHEATARYHVLAVPGADLEPTFIKIDASSDYRSHGRVFLTSDEAMSRVRLVNGIVSVAVGDEFICYMIKRILKGSIGAARIAYLRRLWASDVTGCASAAARVLSASTVDDLKQLMQAGSDIEAALLAMRGLVLRGSLLRRPLAPVVLCVQEVPRVLDRLVRRTGFQVAVLGPDGVGKTTVLSSLERGLTPAFRASERLHLRPGVLGASRRTKEASAAPYQARQYSGLISILKLGYLVLDYVVGYWVRVWPRLISSTLLLCDRYYLDVVADPVRYRYGGPGRLPLAVSRIIPGPDYYIVLTTTVSRIQERKCEVPAEQTAAQLDAYSHLGEASRRVTVIDASAGVESVALAVEWAVLHRMSERRVVVR